eukprot:549197_1
MTEQLEASHDEQYNEEEMKIKQKTLTHGFVVPTASDYNACGSIDHHIINCNIANRIFCVLKHYNGYQSPVNSGSTVVSPICEYLDSINYEISAFMEDCFQFKSHHLTQQEDIALFLGDSNISCIEPTTCLFASRFQREKPPEHSEPTDYKNVILMNQLSALHALIFHPTQKSLNRMNRMNIAQDTQLNYDEKEEAKYDTNSQEYKVKSVWESRPTMIEECDLSQILYILSNTHIIDNFDMLKDYKSEIIDYVSEYNCDGKTLVSTPRKQFVTKMVGIFKNKKLSGSFGRLYTAIIKYDIKAFIENYCNVWANNPQCIQECNVKQVLCILDRIYDEQNKLKNS